MNPNLSTPSSTQAPLVSAGTLKKLLFAFPLFAYLQGFFKDLVISIMKTGPVPQHVAVIMDGNRTFARKRNLPLKEGHTAGAESLVGVLDACYRLGVSCVTIYAFSIENFHRSKEEVDTLFGLLREKLNYLSQNEDSYAMYNKVQVKIIGNKAMIPEDILKDLERVEERTNHNFGKRVLNVCFPYTSRDDITGAIRSISEKRINHEINKEDINMDLLDISMYFGPETPPLDIMIRTSGHTRLSDFMIWQCNYDCTLEFVDTLWPDFKFFDIMAILFKWGYYKTLETEKLKHLGKRKAKLHQTAQDILKDLPAHPPYRSVSDR
ncbi:ditrans,polycis-polyprenyl diphosphate synthase [Yamadazyma tenuis]|uniref:Alkyl transferase n=1 Tax=Candida tenuis (strain ATCC 10573 / BCRC 21748 / CBS 615 / JCM 9827 / NBRC 10315 / NRRL Y-1498 / VKM Y-70) TaxID=590646 RepID=G3B2N5_CANTC|nr:Di-trans-poly-cis-decaprenylcistransferase [Yamadazyma tenuis ATCC 10573]EGV64723.1 Di-trans-poly-cis-decaprenylcistransferase [Yamadazyma tenuis ATCC 10573]WEJ97510.1 ditrans,polycis-polyprenyl diphosphate synthase [Yamadazyma tenuis]